MKELFLTSLKILHLRLDRSPLKHWVFVLLFPDLLLSPFSMFPGLCFLLSWSEAIYGCSMS